MLSDMFFSLLKFIKSNFCKHDYEYINTWRGDNHHLSHYECKKCGYKRRTI